MKRGASAFVPFFAPANVATRVEGLAGIDGSGDLKLEVISGGPVFLWLGRVETKEAQRKVTTPATNDGDVEFDMAATGVNEAVRCLDTGSPTLVTVFAAVDTIGYVQYNPHRH